MIIISCRVLERNMPYTRPAMMCVFIAKPPTTILYSTNVAYGHIRLAFNRRIMNVDNEFRSYSRI